MADIFISYASEDREQARQLADALRHQGWSVWWDRTIPTGRRFSEVIDEAINAASCVVVLWSRISVEKDWVLEEAEYGKERGILIPVFIEDVQPPWGFRRIQAANLYDWNGTETHLAFQKLVNDITGILGPSPAAIEAKHKEGTDQHRIAEVAKLKTDSESSSDQATSPPPVSPTGSNLARKKIFARGVAAVGAIFFVVILLYVYQEPAEQPVPPAESGAVEKGEPTSISPSYLDIIARPEPTLEPDEMVETPVVVSNIVSPSLSRIVSGR